MATTKKLSFGLDKAGGAALILARIGAALLWIIAALAAVVWVVFLISPRSFAANFGSVDLNVGGEMGIRDRPSIVRSKVRIVRLRGVDSATS